jgi:hypothetical protein
LELLAAIETEMLSVPLVPMMLSVLPLIDADNRHRFSSSSMENNGDRPEATARARRATARRGKRPDLRLLDATTGYSMLHLVFLFLS